MASPRFMDLSGQRFGSLVALHRVGSAQPVVWLCKCDCGNTVEMRAKNLRAGSVSCGCQHRVAFDDLLGMRFGRLTVVERMPKSTRRASIPWRCLCDCGAERVVFQGELRSGVTRGCGIDHDKIDSLKRAAASVSVEDRVWACGMFLQSHWASCAHESAKLAQGIGPKKAAGAS